MQLKFNLDAQGSPGGGSPAPSAMESAFHAVMGGSDVKQDAAPSPAQNPSNPDVPSDSSPGNEDATLAPQDQPEEFEGDPNSRANVRIRKLLEEKKGFEERVRTFEEKIAQVNNFFQQHGQAIEVAKALSQNQDVLGQVVNWLEQGLQAAENTPANSTPNGANPDPLANLDPSMAQVIRGLQNEVGQLKKEKEEHAKRQAEQEAYQRAEQRFNEFDQTFSKICKANGIQDGNEQSYLFNSLMMQAVQEFAPEVFSKLLVQMGHKISPAYFEQAFKNHLPGLEKLRNNVKKSLEIPNIPASGSNLGVPTAKANAYSNDQELVDGFAAELRAMHAGR